jgi:hypothetical protein
VADSHGRAPGSAHGPDRHATGPRASAREAPVDTIQASRLANLKEPRASIGRAHLRVLFVFDPARRAVLLVGGNKAGQWQSWYRRAIPEAERLYAQHVETMKRSKR